MEVTQFLMMGIMAVMAINPTLAATSPHGDVVTARFWKMIFQTNTLF